MTFISEVPWLLLGLADRTTAGPWESEEVECGRTWVSLTMAGSSRQEVGLRSFQPNRNTHI